MLRSSAAPEPAGRVPDGRWEGAAGVRGQGLQGSDDSRVMKDGWDQRREDKGQRTEDFELK